MEWMQSMQKAINYIEAYDNEEHAKINGKGSG